MLHAIAKTVKDNNADIGFGFDGDGDRVGVIDNTGSQWQLPARGFGSRLNRVGTISFK